MTRYDEREVHIRGNRRVFRVVLVVGCAGLSLAMVFESFREPFALFAFSVATLSGLMGVLDRRVKLTLSSRGIRYAPWGPRLAPWDDFSGYRLVTWRRNSFLQMVPRRPSQLLESFSWLGKLNNHCARFLGAPDFAIAITPLDISKSELVNHAEWVLPECM